MVSVQNYQKVIIASADTDIFVSSIFHFVRWVHLDLLELWVLCGQGATSRAVPIHEVVKVLDSAITDLAAVHALTGCDTTSKVG